MQKQEMGFNRFSDMLHRFWVTFETQDFSGVVLKVGSPNIFGFATEIIGIIIAIAA